LRHDGLFQPAPLPLRLSSVLIFVEDPVWLLGFFFFLFFFKSLTTAPLTSSSQDEAPPSFSRGASQTPVSLSLGGFVTPAVSRSPHFRSCSLPVGAHCVLVILCLLRLPCLSSLLCQEILLSVQADWLSLPFYFAFRTIRPPRNIRHPAPFSSRLLPSRASFLLKFSCLCIFDNAFLLFCPFISPRHPSCFYQGFCPVRLPSEPSLSRKMPLPQASFFSCDI